MEMHSAAGDFINGKTENGSPIDPTYVSRAPAVDDGRAFGTGSEGPQGSFGQPRFPKARNHQLRVW